MSETATVAAMCPLCRHEPKLHAQDGCTAPGRSASWPCPCYMKPAYAAGLKPHTIRMSRPWRTVDGERLSYWPKCSCGWEGLSYSRRAPAVQDGARHLLDMEAVAARPSAPASEDE